MEIQKAKMDNKYDHIRIYHFLRDKFEEKPNRTNSLRWNIFNDVMNGLSSKEIIEKYEIKTKDASKYMNKVLARFGEYAGLKNRMGLRKIIKGFKK